MRKLCFPPDFTLPTPTTGHCRISSHSLWVHPLVEGHFLLVILKPLVGIFNRMKYPCPDTCVSFSGFVHAVVGT